VRRHAELRQPAGEQRGRHYRPAYVRGAQHEDAHRTGIVLPFPWDAVNIFHGDIARFRSFKFAIFAERAIWAFAAEIFIAPPPGVRSLL
jgi:hypothetical protein